MKAPKNMPPKHHFKDEWIVRALDRIASVTPAAIDDFRKQSRPCIADSLIQAKLVTPEDLGNAVAAAFHVKYASLTQKSVDKFALSLIPEKMCRQYQLLPLRIDGENIEIAMANPLDLNAIADVQVLAGRTPVAYYCRQESLEALMAEVFDADTLVYDLLHKLETGDVVEVLPTKHEEDPKVLQEVVRTPVIKLVNSIIAKAVRLGASDIHIEHSERISAVRFRIDGILKNVLILPRNLAIGPVVARIKIMSDLDISDHYRPQDGRAKIHVGAVEMNLRVSILPTNFGEKVAIRILDKRSAEIPLEQLGFKPDLATSLNDCLRVNQGLILVTGPTGSGKTTTLYSILHKLKAEDTNIITIEDPIEYRIDGINQVQVNEKQGLTFASVLRSILRQDPDVIMVGEIRDRETADIALQAALTGHLVLTTLHTSDTISTISRLLDMGVERFKMAPGLIAITAQRLVRRLCADCKQPVPDQEKNTAVVAVLKDRKLNEKYFKTAGCEKCAFSGYLGRFPLLEFLKVDQQLKMHIVAGDEEETLRQQALSKGSLHALQDDALWHLSAGNTSIEEILPYLSSKTEKPDLSPTTSVPKPAAPALPAIPQAGAPAAKEARRILVVDDDSDIRTILRTILTKQGYQVYEACDGVQALARVVEHQPELMLLDLSMPNLNGHEVIRTVRKNFLMANLCIIVLTSHSDDQSQEEAINSGADDYIIKPFKPALVLARINAAFRRMNV